MNEDAFARRFYADRSELEALGIVLAVEKPVDGLVEQENYSLPPENFHLPPIEFSDQELAALRTALQLLDGEFAYAEPLRLALQQISGGGRARSTRPSSTRWRSGSPARPVATRSRTAWPRSRPRSSAARRSCSTTTRWRATRWEPGASIPTSCCTRAGSSIWSASSHERGAIRVFRLSRIRGKVGYATKAEHDFQRPADFDPRVYANRIDWQFGQPIGVAEVWIGSRIAWQIERHFGPYGEMRAGGEDGDRVFVTSYADSRQLIAWVLGLGEHARILSPPELVDRAARPRQVLIDRHTGEAELAAAAPTTTSAPAPLEPTDAESGNGHNPDAAIRPERFARLVTLASILIEAGRGGRRLDGGRAVPVAQDLRPGAARGHLGAERRQLRRRHLRAVRGDRR